MERGKANKESTKKIDYNKIELEACYDVIKELNEKNEKMEKILKEKYGIEIIIEHNMS